MPAVTVPDLTVLPRLDAPRMEAKPRPVVQRTDAPSGVEGEGFPVRRAFAGVDLALLDPFIHMDQMGEVDYAPGEPKGTPWHPHRGFETVTYIVDGVFDHQDSFGGGGTITNGDTQWMTAGAGLLHIEAPPEWLVQQGGLFHGIQLWVNLPRSIKLATPRYQDIRAGSVGLGTTADAGALVRVIAGDVAGLSGPGTTHTPMALAHATLAPGAQLELPWPKDYNALVYVLSGSGTIGTEGAVGAVGTVGTVGMVGTVGTVGTERTAMRTGNLAVLGRGDYVTVSAAPLQETGLTGLDVLVLGGKPIREPIAWAGPFVMNTRAEVVQAFEDFQKGRLGSIPAVHGAPTELVEG